MPTGCKTTEKQAPRQFTGGKIVTLPWCVTHMRWFAECQLREVFDAEPSYEGLPPGVTDFTQERAKRKKEMKEC